MSQWGKEDTFEAAPKWLTKVVAVDASSNTVVDVAANTIKINGHGLDTGAAVVYTAANTAIGGLTSTSKYYVVRVDPDTVRLAANTSNAAANTTIDLTTLADVTGDIFRVDPENLFFIDATEAADANNIARGLNSPGWWKYTTYTAASGATRHKAEHLVAISSPSAAEDRDSF